MSRDATHAHPSLTHQADRLDLELSTELRLCIAPSGSRNTLSRCPRNRQQAKVGRPFNSRTPRTRDGVGLNPATLLVRRETSWKGSGCWTRASPGDGRTLATFPGRQGRNGHKLERLPLFWLARSRPDQILDLALARAVKHAGPLARAISSAVEHSLHTGGVAGSIPASPTIQSRQTDPVSLGTKTIAIPVG